MPEPSIDLLKELQKHVERTGCPFFTDRRCNECSFRDTATGICILLPLLLKPAGRKGRGGRRSRGSGPGGGYRLPPIRSHDIRRQTKPHPLPPPIHQSPMPRQDAALPVSMFLKPTREPPYVTEGEKAVQDILEQHMDALESSIEGTALPPNPLTDRLSQAEASIEGDMLTELELDIELGSSGLPHGPLDNEAVTRQTTLGEFAGPPDIITSLPEQTFELQQPAIEPPGAPGGDAGPAGG